MQNQERRPAIHSQTYPQFSSANPTPTNSNGDTHPDPQSLPAKPDTYQLCGQSPVQCQTDLAKADNPPPPATYRYISPIPTRSATGGWRSRTAPPESSLGVWDVLGTKIAGRSGRSVGMLRRVYVDPEGKNGAIEEVGLISVEGVE
jgi:hypothetical protein